MRMRLQYLTQSCPKKGFCFRACAVMADYGPGRGEYACAWEDLACWKGGAVRRVRRAGAVWRPSMCVCESLTGSKWRRLLLCEGKSLGAAGRESVLLPVGRLVPAGQTKRPSGAVSGRHSRHRRPTYGCLLALCTGRLRSCPGGC